MGTIQEIEQAKIIFNFYKVYGLTGEGPSDVNEVLSMILSSHHLSNEDSNIQDQIGIICRTSIHRERV